MMSDPKTIDIGLAKRCFITSPGRTLVHSSGLIVRAFELSLWDRVLREAAKLS